MPNTDYRIKHPEYRLIERVRDAERKRIKYNSDPEFRELVKKRNIDNYNSKKPAFRNCKECANQIEYIPRRVFCVDCYKKRVNIIPTFINDD